MNEERIDISKEKAIEAVRQYRKIISEEFLHMAESLSKQMDELCKKGIDTKRHLRFKYTNCEDNTHDYVLLDKRKTIEFKELLDKMNSEDAIEMFSCIVIYSQLYYYDELNGMEDLASAYSDAKSAELILK